MSEPQDETPVAGRMLLDSAGERIGRIDAVYVDPETELPQWGLVHLGFLSSKQTLVPLAGAAGGDGVLRVPWDRRVIRSAPAFSSELELTSTAEQALALHYGVRLASSEPAAPGFDGTELRRPSELVRVRRTHVEQPVTQRLRLRREELYIEEEPASEQDRERDHLEPAGWELSLLREEPVVEKRRVPFEHVRVETVPGSADPRGRAQGSVRVVRDHAGQGQP